MKASTHMALVHFVVTSVCATSSPFPATAACPNPVQLERGTGCVCSAESCGTFPIPARPSSPSEAVLITTSPMHGFLHHEIIPVSRMEEPNMPISSAGTVKKLPQMAISVDAATPQLQEVVGFGAAITDAVAHCLTTLLTPAAGTALLQQAFVHAGFSMSRVPMGASDFSRRNYALAHSADLSDWCLRDDRHVSKEAKECRNADYKLDVLKRIIVLQPKLRVIVSAWSAPIEYKHQSYDCAVHRHVVSCVPNASLPAAFECMRTVADPALCINNTQGEPCPTDPPHAYPHGFPLEDPMSSRYTATNIPVKNADGNCYNAGFVREDRYAAWAQHYARFIATYAASGVPTWAATTQNEPNTQTGLWPANFWTVAGQLRFLKLHLAPLLRKKATGVKILVFDDQVTGLTNEALMLLKSAGDDADGVAFHWYNSLESTYEDGFPVPASPFPLGLPLVNGGRGVRTLYDAFNGSKLVLMTEACSGYSLGTHFVGPRHGDTGYGYNAAHDVLWSMRNHASGWLYWNLLLDSRGGPNLAGNFVDSPSYVLNATAFVLNPSFFYLAHFSRAVPSGAQAVAAHLVKCTAQHREYCQFVAFRYYAFQANGGAGAMNVEAKKTDTPQMSREKAPADSYLVVVMTNDESTTNIVPSFLAPRLSKGEGKPIAWTLECGEGGEAVKVHGVLPWKGIQTIVMPC